MKKAVVIAIAKPGSVGAGESESGRLRMRANKFI